MHDQPQASPYAVRQTTGYCPKCGIPRQSLLSCACGYEFDDVGFVRRGKKLFGASPMVLPGYCIDCGKDAATGRRVDKSLYGYSPLVWIGLLFGLIPFLLLYYLTKKELRLSLYLCPGCDGARRKRRLAAGGVWTLFVVLMVLAIWLSSGWLGVVTGVCFVAALVASVIASWRLTVGEPQGGVFALKGLSPEFMARLGGRVLD